MSYKPIDFDLTFDKIWEFWIRKEGENAAKKAITLCMKSGNNHAHIIKACRAYALENETSDPEFTHKLSNFINGNDWMDYIDAEGIDILEKERSTAIKIIETWNEKKRKHWIPCLDSSLRIPIVRKALKNQFFRENWKKGLDLLEGIFKYPFRDEDPRSKIIISINWFCNVSPDKHTVLRLIEGALGSPRGEEREIKIKEYRIPTKEERIKALEEWKKIKQKGLNEIEEEPDSRDTTEGIDGEGPIFS